MYDAIANRKTRVLLSAYRSDVKKRVPRVQNRHDFDRGQRETGFLENEINISSLDLEGGGLDFRYDVDERQIHAR
jgi:hypothetical protein